MTTPIFGLDEWIQDQAQPHITVNTALRVIEALAQLSVISRTDVAPPTGPNDGDCWIVPNGGTGEFAGHEGQVAIFIATEFVFKTPRDGWEAWVQDDAERVRFVAGSPGSWTPV